MSKQTSNHEIIDPQDFEIMEEDENLGEDPEFLFEDDLLEDEDDLFDEEDYIDDDSYDEYPDESWFDPWDY
jgi:hypothetical protein